MTETLHRDPMQEFANRIVAELENGVKPWVRPWDPEKAGGPQAPFNPVTGKRYHGINVLILGMDMRAFQSGDPRWMTYQQAQEKKWQVRKGEKSTTIFFTQALRGRGRGGRGRQEDDPRPEALCRVSCARRSTASRRTKRRPSKKRHGRAPKPPTSS